MPPLLFYFLSVFLVYDDFHVIKQKLYAAREQLVPCPPGRHRSRLQVLQHILGQTHGDDSGLASVLFRRDLQ